MTEFSLYDSATGSIFTALSVFDEAEARMNATNGQVLFNGEADGEHHWIDPSTGDRRDREEMTPTVTANTGEATITGLPDPCEVSAMGVVETSTGGSITVEVDVPGSYIINLDASPQYLEHTLEIDIP